jgi:hypothetical protein
MHPKPNLQKSSTKAYAYNSKIPIPIIGQFETRTMYDKQYRKLVIHVVEGCAGNLLGFKSIMEFNIINIVNSIETKEKDDFVRLLIKQYPLAFSNKIGKLKDHLVKLHINHAIKPVRQKHRPTAIHLRPGIEKAIKKMLDNDIIEPVRGPTPWVSPIVPIVKENGEIRVCTDGRILNTAIEREIHRTPTIDEIATELNGAKVISKFDLNSGYNQLELHPDSRDITVFSTHIGEFRYKRLNFGVNSASEEFQKTIEGLVKDIPKVRNISDDIIVFGNNEEEHDKNLHSLLKRIEESGLTFNVKKSVIKQTSLDFFGLNFSKDGVKLKQSKVDALKNAADPRDVKELKSLCGQISYASKFIKDAATLITPFHQLLKRNTPFIWKKEHSDGLMRIKEALTTEAMGYFDENWNTELTTDASPTGLGAVLAQSDPTDPSNRKIILYASRALSSVEQKYSQVEREALAVVWACERLKFYLIGKQFKLNCDNAAVELIFGNPKSKVCARIERWSLRLIPYKFKIKHVPGITNIADYISRHATEEVKVGDDYVEEYVNSIVDNNLSLDIRLESLIQATNDDETLNKVKIMMDTNDCQEEILKPYFNIRHELSSTSDGLILYGTRIIIPKSHQKEIISVAHQSHQGKEKTKQLLNQFVWFTNMNSKVDNFINSCHICNANSEKKEFQPFEMSKIPNGVWEELATDFHGPTPSGEYIMVMIDEFSRFPIIEFINTNNADTVIKIWKKTFGIFGNPNQMKTDNGPPFQSHAISKFLKSYNIKHRKITPLWPRANAICERFMRNINRVMRNSKVNGSNWKDDLEIFLSQYRATPHDSTGIPPAKLMLKTRSSSAGLPILFNVSQATSDKNVESLARENDKKAKNAMKVYADKKLKTKPHNFQIDDKVYVKSNPGNKSTPRYDPEYFKITKINGSMIEAKREDKLITRNCSFFRKLVDCKDFDERLFPIPIINPVINKTLVTTNSPTSSFTDTATSTEHLNSPKEFFMGTEQFKKQGEDEALNNTIHDGELENNSEIEFSVHSDEAEEEEKETRKSTRRKTKPIKYSDTEEENRQRAMKEILKQKANLQD